MTRSKIARNLAFNKVKKFTSNLMIFENSFCKYVTSWLQNKKNLCKIYYDKLNIDNFIFFMQIINFFYFERNFQYLQCSDLDKILHGGSPWCEIPPVKNLSKLVNFTTRIKKKPHPFVAEWKRHKKLIQNFFVQLILKIFEFSFILDQPQVCISNRLGDRACQSEPLFCKNVHFSIGLQN